MELHPSDQSIRIETHSHFLLTPEKSHWRVLDYLPATVCKWFQFLLNLFANPHIFLYFLLITWAVCFDPLVGIWSLIHHSVKLLCPLPCDLKILSLIKKMLFHTWVHLPIPKLLPWEGVTTFPPRKALLAIYLHFLLTFNYLICIHILLPTLPKWTNINWFPTFWWFLKSSLQTLWLEGEYQ